MGLSEADWEQLQQAYSASLARAKGHSKYQNWDLAIAEYSQAFAIRPIEVEAAFGLASAYEQRWRENKAETDKREAIKFAQICLRQDPRHEGALQLMSRLGRTANPARNKRKRWLLAMGAIILALFVGKNLLRTSSPQKSSPPPPGPASRPASPSAVSASTLSLPLQFVEHDQLRFQSFASSLAVYDSAYSYKLRAYLPVEGMELSALKLKIELLDEQASVLYSEVFDALASHQPVARAGDLLAIGYDHYQKGVLPIAGARLGVHSMQQAPAPAAYQPAAPLQLKWERPPPANIALTAGMRLDQLSSSRFTAQSFHKIVLEITNQGQANLQRLKLRLDWKDERGEVLQSKSLYVVSTSTPPLLAGQRRTAGGTYSLDKQQAAAFRQLEVVVEEVVF
ncbi:MAG: hypothetical protein D6730_15275 [Bacteroidetes bacterium]|nr:MAG: hypothetical protein D6730_15275 [Bacteroidota bacterium]